MFRLIVPVAALMLGSVFVHPAAAQSGADLVKQAVDAQGGADALRRGQQGAPPGDRQRRTGG